MNYNNPIELDFSDKISLAAKEKKTLNKPFRTPGGPKKFSVYVKNEKGNIVKVNFGDPNMEIKRDDPARRRSFRARHQCDSNPGPKWKARYWSCKFWSKPSVTKLTNASANVYQEVWDGETFWDQAELLKIWPDLSKAQEVEIEDESEELDEYKSDFLGMSIGSLRSIQAHVTAILNNIEDPNVKENLTESFLQGKIAITEDYMLMIHNYVMFNKEDEYSDANDNGDIEEEDDYENGSMVKNVNPSCEHYGSEGIVQSVEDLPNKMGKVVKYKVTNEGPTYKVGDILTKTKDQLRKYDPKKFNPSTLSPEVLKKLKKITEQINPEEKEHGGGNGFSEDEKEYQKKYDQVQW